MKRSYTKEQKEWLLNKLPYYSPIVIAGMYKDRFKQDIKVGTIRNCKTINHIKSDYKRKIFDVSYRDKIRKPLYNEIYIKKTGERRVRVSNRYYQTKKRYVWEQHYGRKIPKGYEVIFLDNNKNNYDINNLALVKKETRIFALKSEIDLNNKDIIKATDLILRLNKKTNKKKKEYRDMWLKDIFKKEKEKEYNNMNLYEEALEKCKNNEEMWVKIKDYEDYELSNLGNCRRLKSDGTYKSIGYYDKTEDRIKIQLHNNKGIKATTLANIMSKVFEIPNPNDRKMVVCIDGNTMNCRLDNLVCCHNKEFKRDYKKNDIEYSDKDRIDKELAKTKLEVKETPEVWKDVVNYERWYEVSNKGNVRRIEVDGSRTLLKATYTEGRARSVGLRMTGPTKNYTIKYLVAQAFNIKPTKDNDRIIYNIDGDLSNDCSYNLTYDKTQTDEYIKEQERIKAEQEEKEKLEQEKQNNKNELLNYIENNKEFLKQVKEMNKEITIKDVYDKLCEILEVLKRG